MIEVQLMHRIANMQISEVSRSQSIELLCSLQEVLSTSYVRSVLRVLQMAFAQALRLEAIHPILLPA